MKLRITCKRKTKVYSIYLNENQSLTGKLSHQSANLFSDTVSPLQNDNHKCSTPNSDKFLKKYRSCNCDKLWSWSVKFKKNITRCSESINHWYSTATNQLKETVSEKMRNLEIEVETCVQKNSSSSNWNQSPCTIHLLKTPTPQPSKGTMIPWAFLLILTSAPNLVLICDWLS